MTVLPAKILLSPDVGELGISIANIVLADGTEELRAALRALGEEVKKFSQSLKETEEDLRDLERNLPDAPGQAIQELLEFLSRLEESYARTISKLRSTLDKPKFRELLASTPDKLDVDNVTLLVEAWHNRYIPLIRRVRLSTITLVFRRLQEREVDSAELDAGFPEWFLTAPQQETSGWQETAYLLAVPEEADRLLRSIQITPRDRTDQIPGLTA